MAPLSKYCSDYCGIEVTASRLNIENLDHDKLWRKVEGARRREAEVLDAHPKRRKPDVEGRDNVADRQRVADDKTLKALEADLDDIIARRSTLDVQLSLIESRMKYLRVALRRWDALCVAAVAQTAAEAEAAGTTTKPKAKNSKKPTGGPTTAPEALCGFDVRLVFDDVAWAEWVLSDEGRTLLAREEGGDSDALAAGLAGGEEEVVCMRLRKKCDRHKGWQQVRDADFQVEMAALVSPLLGDAGPGSC